MGYALPVFLRRGIRPDIHSSIDLSRIRGQYLRAQGLSHFNGDSTLTDGRRTYQHNEWPCRACGLDEIPELVVRRKAPFKRWIHRRRKIDAILHCQIVKRFFGHGGRSWGFLHEATRPPRVSFPVAPSGGRLGPHLDRPSTPGRSGPVFE